MMGTRRNHATVAVRRPTKAHGSRDGPDSGAAGGPHPRKMTMRSTVTFIVVSASFAISLSTLTGCGGGDSEEQRSVSSASTSAESFCDSFCRKLSTCDKTQDFETCTAQCETSTSDVTKKLRGAVTKQ